MARVVTIPIGPIFTSGPCRGIIHVIEKGDTLYKLGQRYHVSVSRIMYANPYVNIYNLQIGDELCIPVGQEPRAGEMMGQTEFGSQPIRQNMEQPSNGSMSGGGEMPANRTMAMEERVPGGQEQMGNRSMPGGMEQVENRSIAGEPEQMRDQEMEEASAESRSMPDFMTHPPMEGMFDMGYREESRGRSKEQCKSHYPVS